MHANRAPGTQSRGLPKRQTIVMDNALINAAYSLTLNEKRLLLMVVSQINPMVTPDPTGRFVYCISTDEWRMRFKTRSKSLYTELKAACRTLMDRPAFNIPLGDGRYALAKWSPWAELKPEEGTIEIHIYYELMLYLAGFVDHFTQYDLLNVQSMRSFYAIRLYELLAQYRKVGRRTFDLEEFRSIIDPDGKYPRYQDLRRFIIERGVEEINSRSDMRVMWSPITQGRKTTGVEFGIRKVEKILPQKSE